MQANDLKKRQSDFHTFDRFNEFANLFFNLAMKIGDWPSSWVEGFECFFKDRQTENEIDRSLLDSFHEKSLKDVPMYEQNRYIYKTHSQKTIYENLKVHRPSYTLGDLFDDLQLIGAEKSRIDELKKHINENQNQNSQL